MKKVDVWYVLKGIAVFFLTGIALIILGTNLYLGDVGGDLGIYVIMAGILVWGAMGALPGILETRMEKRALELEREFSKHGFTYDYKFSSHNGIFFLASSGRIGIVWKCNPFELQFADPTKITAVRTDSGQMLFGTSLVSCQFLLEGKKIKIYTLRVRRGGQLGMKDPKVLEAISKADELCALIKDCQRNTIANAAHPGPSGDGVQRPSPEAIIP